MAVTDPLKNLMDKKMSRKEFLKHAGLSLVALAGVNAAIQALSQPGSKSAPNRKSTKGRSGFGGGRYGA